MSNWIWQPRSVEAFHNAVAEGQRRIVLQLPTGMGKTMTAGLIVKDYLSECQRCVFYANRRNLVNQTSAAMDKAGIVHGLRMAGRFAELHHPFQISSIQTESERLAGDWELHNAHLAIFDEGHLHTAGKARDFAIEHLDKNAVLLYLTATPFGMDDIADHLIIGGTKEEGRKAGAIVPAIMYGPDQPDLKTIGIEIPEDNFSEAQCTRAMGAVNDRWQANTRLVKLFGRIGEHFDRLNPDRRPTMVFAPGVKESIWIVDRFIERGITAAHIDADNIYYGERAPNGVPIFYESSGDAGDANRTELREKSKSGDLKVVSSRFLMREGVDWPWIEHIILATIIGTYQTFIQTVGRGLRAYPGKERCIIQDHGGNYWRHGSPNADYEWRLDMTNRMATASRYDDLREGRAQTPYCCPKCRLILRHPNCPCGFQITPGHATRPVVTIKGDLVEMSGPILEKRKRIKQANAAALWAQCFFRAVNSKIGMTPAQAEGNFVRMHHFWPERNLPYMPMHSFDWFRPAKDIPRDRLIPRS